MHTNTAGTQRLCDDPCQSIIIKYHDFRRSIHPSFVSSAELSLGFPILILYSSTESNQPDREDSMEGQSIWELSESDLWVYDSNVCWIFQQKVNRDVTSCHGKTCTVFSLACRMQFVHGISASYFHSTNGSASFAWSLSCLNSLSVTQCCIMFNNHTGLSVAPNLPAGRCSNCNVNTCKQDIL